MLFDELDKKIKWEGLVQTWKHFCIFYPILSEEMSVKIIPCKSFREGASIYGYDFIPKEDVAEREKNIQSFFIFDTPTNKGTLQTISMLRSTQSDEERMAIWCAAFSKDMWDKGLRLKQDKNYLFWLGEKCKSFLRGKFTLWHHAMKSLTPNIYYDFYLWENITVISCDALMELIALNAKMVLQDYQLVLYSSLGEQETIKKMNEEDGERIKGA